MTRLAAVAAVAAGLLIPSAADAAPKRVDTVKLLHNTTARTYPGASAPKVAAVASRRPLTGAPTVLPVIGRAQSNGRPWVRVLLPQRPNSGTGWVPADGTVRGSTAWAVIIDRSRRRAKAYRAGRVVRSFPVVVGAPSTPTPLGSFFVAERVRQPSGAQIGPWALATSAYSNVLQEFAGGPGQIAMHGRTGLSDPLGSAASHGCVRFSDAAIVWLSKRLRAGTPLTVTA